MSHPKDSQFHFWLVKTHEDCFIFSVLASLHPAQHNKDRPSHYLSHMSDYDFSKCQGIVTLRDISWFERKNNITVNVYSLDQDDKTIIPLKVSIRKERFVNLFLYQEHYFCIAHFSRFLGEKSGFRRHYCYFCLHGTRTAAALEKHIEYCKSNGAQRVELPQSGCIKFSQYEKMLKVPFIVYADFETFVLNTDDDQSKTTFQHQSFEACSYSYLIVNWKHEVVRERIFRGHNAAVNFLQDLD